MDYIMKDVLSGELIPVLLGISSEAAETARRMYREYGVVSHVFCTHVPFTMRISLCMKYHIVKHTEKERLLMTALEDFAGQLENSDTILYLIPCTEEYANVLFFARSDLERRFVIADRAEMEKVWFGNSEAEAENA